MENALSAITHLRLNLVNSEVRLERPAQVSGEPCLACTSLDSMSAARQAASQVPQHRNASWISTNAVPYVAAVGGAVAFALYSATRVASANPEVGRKVDIDADTSKAADTFRASPLRKAVAGDPQERM